MAVNQVSMNSEELINLTNDTVSELSLLSGETAHDASGKRIEGKAQYINPNLIINYDFSINQRGESEYSGAGAPIVDGWSFHVSGGTVYYTDAKSFTFPEAPAGNWFGIVQKIENIPAGKTVTWSADITTDVDIYMRVFCARPSGDTYEELLVPVGTSGIISFTSYIPDDTTLIDLQFTNAALATAGGTVKVEETKLELGLIATPSVKSNKALELIKCQRYLQFHTTGNINPVDLRPTMRITPTVTQMEDGRWMYNAEL